MSHEIHPFTPLKLLRHSDRIEQAERGELVYPVSVELDLSNTCNHHCSWCSFNGFRQEHWVQLDGDRVLALLDELKALGVQSVTYTGGGEPLTHKRKEDIFTRTEELGLRYGLVTNGLLLTGPVAWTCARSARFVRVSLDAGLPQTHQLLHGTVRSELDTILRNMRALRDEAGPALTLGVSFCVFDMNWQEIPLAAQQVQEAGGDYLEIRPVLPTDWRGGGFSEVLSPEHVDAAQALIDDTRDRMARSRFKIIGSPRRFASLHAPGKPYAHCHIGPLTTVVSATGTVYQCCQQRGIEAFAVGSIQESSFKDIWMTPAHRAMMAGIDVSLCPACRYDGYNELIEAEFGRGDLHSEFI